MHSLNLAVLSPRADTKTALHDEWHQDFLLYSFALYVTTVVFSSITRALLQRLGITYCFHDIYPTEADDVLAHVIATEHM